MYQEALRFARQMAAKRGSLLFVGTKRQARDILREEAQRCAMPYVDHRWLGGMLTNFKTVKQSIKRLKEIDRKSTRLNSSHGYISYAVFCLKKKKKRIKCRICL